MPFQAQPNEKCTACGKTVYLTEKTVVEEKTDKKVYHKQCIRCSTCNKVLTTGQYSSMDGQFWCKPHFKQLFATKGNYDEAFGKEKATSKWDSSSAPTSTPTSFVPEVKTDTEKEKKPTSEATMEKFRAFRTEGDADKCSACSKTVYLAEKLLVEDRNEKRTFHKQCFKCSVCNMILDLRTYGSSEGKIYCKNHLKEKVESTRQTSGTVVTAPTSFIPATESDKKTEKGQTPENIAAKFKSAETEKCKACNKSVYATEKVTLPESFKQQSIYHKNCLKCSVCSCKLDVSNYGSSAGVLYCHTHLKSHAKPEQAKGDYFISPLANTNADYVPGPREGDAPISSDREDEPKRAEESDREEQQRNDERDRDSDREVESSRGGRESPDHSAPEEDRSAPEEGESPAVVDRRAEDSASEETVERQEQRSEREDDGEDDGKRREAERARKREERQRQIEAEEREQEEDRERRRREREKRLAESSEGESARSEDSGNSREAERERRRKEREEERRREEEERERLEEKRRKEREDRRREQEEETERELKLQEKKAEERRRKLEELKGSD